MDQHLYKEILREDLYETIEEYEMDITRVIFQHDGDPKHTAKSERKWLNEQPFDVLD